MVFALVLNPLALMILPFSQLKIVPVFNEIFASLKLRMAVSTSQMIHLTPFLFWLEMLLALLLYICALLLTRARRRADHQHFFSPAQRFQRRLGGGRAHFHDQSDQRGGAAMKRCSRSGPYFSP